MSPDQLFPITYSLDVPWRNGGDDSVLEGTITGFGWLVEFGAENREIR
jgi:hypothetical protein